MRKNNRLLIALSVILVAFAAIFALLGFILSGHDVAAWFCSSQAIVLYIAMGVYAIAIAFMWLNDKVRRM